MKHSLSESEKRWLHVDDNTTLLLQYNSEDVFFEGWRTFFIPWGKERDIVTLNAFVMGSASHSFYKKIEALYNGIFDFATLREEGKIVNVARVRKLRGRSFDSTWRRLSIAGKGQIELASNQIRFNNETENSIFQYLVESYFQDHYVKRLAMQDSGWRSLSNIAGILRISLTSFYPIEESTLLGSMKQGKLIEIGNFTGQRGRGGNVIGIRLAISDSAVKEAVEKRVKTRPA